MPTGIYERRKGKHGRPRGIPSKFKKIKRVQWREVGLTLRDTVTATPFVVVAQGTRSPRTTDEVLDVMEYS
jgi:hypothetical protein